MANWIDTLEGDAKKAALALKYGAMIDWQSAWAELDETFSNPGKALTDGSVQGELGNLDEILKIAGLFFPPAAIAANDLGIAVGLMPMVIAGFGLLSMGKIPQVTLDTEATIASRFGTTDAPRLESREKDYDK